MKRAKLTALVVVLVLVGVAGATTLQLIRRQDSLHASAAQPLVAEPVATPQEIVFEWKGVLDYITDRGLLGSSQTFEANDGMPVVLITEDCGSPNNAGKALQEELSKAGKVVERGSLLDEKGRVIGDRVVAPFTTASDAKERIAVLRTERKQFYIIESSSLRHALLLEKKFFNKASQPGDTKQRGENANPHL